MGLIDNTLQQIRSIVDLNGHMDTENAEKAIRSNIFSEGRTHGFWPWQS